MKYLDNYQACNRTYATLLIYPGEASIESISFTLGLKPTHTSEAQDLPRKKLRGWFLSTQESINSKDSRRHIDHLIDLILPLIEKLDKLRESGVRIEICCFWESASGNGGPTMSPTQMKALGELNLELWWDIWFSDDENI